MPSISRFITKIQNPLPEATSLVNPSNDIFSQLCSTYHAQPRSKKLQLRFSLATHRSIRNSFSLFLSPFLGELSPSTSNGWLCFVVDRLCRSLGRGGRKRGRSCPSGSSSNGKVKVCCWVKCAGVSLRNASTGNLIPSIIRDF